MLPTWLVYTSQLTGGGVVSGAGLNNEVNRGLVSTCMGDPLQASKLAIYICNKSPRSTQPTIPPG